MDRRSFLKDCAIGAGVSAVAASGTGSASPAQVPVEPPALEASRRLWVGYIDRALWNCLLPECLDGEIGSMTPGCCLRDLIRRRLGLPDRVAVIAVSPHARFLYDQIAVKIHDPKVPETEPGCHLPVFVMYIKLRGSVVSTHEPIQWCPELEKP